MAPPPGATSGPLLLKIIISKQERDKEEKMVKNKRNESKNENVVINKRKECFEYLEEPMERGK